MKDDECEYTEESDIFFVSINRYYNPQPMQPVQLDSHGVARFRANEIVRYILDNGSIDMNDIAINQDFKGADREQFYQLIGYSVSGFGDLGHASKETVKKADRKVKKLAKAKVGARAIKLADRLANMKASIENPKVDKVIQGRVPIIH